MKRDLQVYIADILECIGKIEEYTKTITEHDFYENSQIHDAVLRRLERIFHRNSGTNTLKYHGKRLQE